MSNLFKFIQTYSTEFTVQAEFTVHSAGLSVNSAGLSAKWQNRPVGDFTVQILNQMDFGRFSPNFTEFGRFFQKPAGSEGADFLVSAGFLNTDVNTLSTKVLFGFQLKFSYF